MSNRTLPTTAAVAQKLELLFGVLAFGSFFLTIETPIMAIVSGHPPKVVAAGFVVPALLSLLWVGLAVAVRPSR